MKYNFYIPDNKDKKIKKLLKKLDKVHYMLDNGIFIFVGIMAVSFCAIKLLGKFTPVTILNGHNIVSLILSFCIAGFLTSFFHAVINEKGIYKRLYKRLNLPVFVESIDVMIPESGMPREKLGDLLVPEVLIDYNVDCSGEKIALLTPVDNGKYKIISMLDTSSKGKKSVAVSPKELADGIRDTYEAEELLILAVCHIYNDKGGYVKIDDIDQRLIVEEAFLKYAEIH